jgi:hypothetical protein
MNEQNGQDIVVLNNQGLADTTDDIIASAERRVAQIDKVVTLAIKRTNAQDWVDQQGKPYLTSSGAEKIARLFGVSWKILKSEKVNTNDEKGTFYFYQVTGVFSLAGGKDSVEAVGTCSSKDQFFAKCGGEFKPMSEVDETNIMKAAYSNCIGNGITRLLGIRNLTWDQVHAGGIDSSKTAKVSYAAGGAGGGKISEAQQKRFFAIAKQAGKKEDQIKGYLKSTFKIEHTKDMEKASYEAACTWAASTEDDIHLENQEAK